MCGIVGYIGEENAVNIVLDCLKRLEYRGYDSSGVAFFEGENIINIKEKGTLENLEKRIENKCLNKNSCLGHTRWATHGEPDEINAHPHKSQNGLVSVVHNGIIENYQDLKQNLKHIKFLSQTDTEVFANLLGCELMGDENETEILKVIEKTCKKLKGSFSFGIMIKNHPEKIFFAKNKSPLVVGIGEKGCYISSDAIALLKHTKKVLYPKDGDVGYISKDETKVFSNFCEVKREVTYLKSFQEQAQKGKYDSFMEKEIEEGSFSVFNTILHLKNFDIKKLEKFIKNSEKVYVVGCGTALHAGMIFSYLLERECGVNVNFDYASEFRYKKPNINEKSLCIFISQSGETQDTIKSLELAKSKKAKTVAITNVLNSRITQIAHLIIPTYAGIEISVASTKAFMAQLSSLYFLLTTFSNVLGKKLGFSIDDIVKISSKIKKTTKKQELELLSKILVKENSLYFVGRGLDYFLAKEGALKLKETSYIHCEAIAGGELKHGSLSLITKNSFVICVLTQKTLFEKMINNILEMRARGAKIILFSQFLEAKKYCDYFLKLPKEKSILMPFILAKPLQELALCCSKEKGLNPDKPRNLAKSVTVE